MNKPIYPATAVSFDDVDRPGKVSLEVLSNYHRLMDTINPRFPIHDCQLLQQWLVVNNIRPDDIWYIFNGKCNTKHPNLNIEIFVESIRDILANAKDNQFKITGRHKSLLLLKQFINQNKRVMQPQKQVTKSTTQLCQELLDVL